MSRTSEADLRDRYARGLRLLRDYLAVSQTGPRDSLPGLKLSVARGTPLRRILDHEAAVAGTARATLQADVELAKAVEAITANCGDRWRDVLLSGRVTPKQLSTLSGRHADRQRFAVAAVAEGHSPESKPAAGLPTFETVGWHEIPSRLWRAEGKLRTASRLLGSRPEASCGDDLERHLAQLERCRDLAAATAVLLSDLGVDLARPAPRPSRRPATRRNASRPGERVETGAEGGTETLPQMIGSARGLLEKNLRDLPRLARETGVDSRHAADAADWLALIGEAVGATLSRHRRRPARDRAGLPLPCPGDRQVATHRKPDVDAAVACWLAERFLFPGEPVQVVFVPRDYPVPDDCPYDCVLDVGRSHNPTRLLFDHKPPAVADRHSTCATRQLWGHLRASGREVAHLAGLVDLVWDGDSSRRRPRSTAYRVSRENGLHAEFARLRDGSTDAMLYVAMRAWLDRRYLWPGNGVMPGKGARIGSDL